MLDRLRHHGAASAPDGYTLLLAENALGMSQALHRKATSSFDPLTPQKINYASAGIGFAADWLGDNL